MTKVDESDWCDILPSVAQVDFHHFRGFSMNFSFLKSLMLVAFAVSLGLCNATQKAVAAVQSPINITSYNTLYDPLLPSLNFSYSSSTTLDVHNTGSPDVEATIKAFVGAGAGSISVNGTTYDLLQLHFHTEAEHLVNGVRGAMEVHFVHKSLANEFLVVGQIIDVGAFNSSYAPIFSDLPVNNGDTRSVSNFSLAALLPSTLTSFRYEGSLTTAPYTTGIKWNVLTTNTTMSQSQIDAFRALFPDGDSREEQEFHGWIRTDLDAFSAVPEPTSMAIFGPGTLGLAFRTRRRAMV